MECNICGCNRFKDMKKRRNARCKYCGSLERTRLLWLYIEKFSAINKNSKVLHFAPELGLSRRIIEIIGGNNYFPVDYAPELYPEISNVKKFNLITDITYVDSNKFDLILHCHVLEHIPCNIAFTLFHLHRVLKPDGIHACVIPFSPGFWDESFSPELSSENRIKRFGQHDHVRKIGKNDANNTIGKIIDIERYNDFDATKDFPIDILYKFNIPESHWYGLSMGTPLLLEKDDYLLTT